MTKEQYEDFRLMLKGCGAGLPMYSTLNRFERVWFSSIIEILTEKDKQIKELEQKLEQTEKDLADYQFNYPTIKELEKEKCELLGIIQEKDKAIKKLIADMAGLEEELEKMTSVAEHQQDCNMKRHFKLEQAKEIIKRQSKIIEGVCDVSMLGSYAKETIKQAEQFLREIDITNAIQKADEGLNLDKIADEVEQDIKEQNNS